MLNKVILMGRITREPELKQTQSGKGVLKFTVAIDRDMGKDKEKQTDFISCVAFGKKAEFIAKYFGKGRMIAVEGNLKTGRYKDKNDVTHYTTEVWIDNASFTGEKSENSSQSGYQSGGYRQDYSQNTSQPVQQYQNQSSNNSVDIGNLADFEEVLSDGGVPF
jgi:single-strand DNA-binding protein